MSCSVSTRLGTAIGVAALALWLIPVGLIATVFWLVSRVTHWVDLRAVAHGFGLPPSAIPAASSSGSIGQMVGSGHVGMGAATFSSVLGRR